MENPLDILDRHPFLKRKNKITEAPMMSTLHSFAFIDNNKSEEFKKILIEANRRLKELLQSNEQATMGEK